jgi:hypothetical protein
MKRTYRDLNELLYERKREGDPISKTELARLLSAKAGKVIWPSKLTALLNPETYRVVIDHDLTIAIAEVLNQPPDYVREFYKSAA